MTAPLDKPSEYLAEITKMAETTPLAKIETPRRTAITPMEMLQIAVERNADLAQLEKLMDLQARWEATEARKAFVVALSEFKAAPPTIVKNRKASFGSRSGGTGTEYGYITLAEAATVIAPALARHGLSHRWHVEQDDKGIAVTCILTHQMGHSESVTLRATADTSGSKNSIQAIGSTVTYLERYSLLAITGLAAADQDDDGVKIGTISAEQKEQLIELMREIPNLDTAAFFKYLGVGYIDLLPANQFDNAVAALEKKKRVAK